MKCAVIETPVTTKLYGYQEKMSVLFCETVCGEWGKSYSCSFYVCLFLYCFYCFLLCYC